MCAVTTMWFIQPYMGDLLC